MRRTSWGWSVLLGVGLALSGGTDVRANPMAVRFPDGRVAFNVPPTFYEANTPYPTVWYPQPIYRFLLRVSENAGEPLHRVMIQQLPSQEALFFEVGRTRAFSGVRGRQPLSISNVEFNLDQQAVMITFDPPISPGTTLTIVLAPRRNPAYEGVYLFGITAYPPGGDRAIGQFIGTGRLQFYRNSDYF
ncbi:DUF2808 domain-containing protein [Candidatus Synechococcus calcipolaris G9]|uniref:DUF2808 domain-containing protein n=1 Tax=Candidatus Synechococcus calcipolaris G9 TaxID=1497997 RepID=A0ABT6EV32_9SYNE|nr:DUF2808 domain-containing protein [Candidatus Synechococcus calcipolaris]MDG2989663.1 DUF2808 domain-containing protein [Candidatus Synechococcus calcipolaris G9]